MKSKRFFGGNTPDPPLREGATLSRTLPQHGLWPCLVAARPLLGAGYNHSYFSFSNVGSNGIACGVYVQYSRETRCHHAQLSHA